MEIMIFKPKGDILPEFRKHPFFVVLKLSLE